MLPVVVVGHSFVRRLAHYALSIEKMNLNLRENDCAISFIGRGGLTEPKLRGMTAAILARRPAILFIEIGTTGVVIIIIMNQVRTHMYLFITEIE